MGSNQPKNNNANSKKTPASKSQAAANTAPPPFASIPSGKLNPSFFNGTQGKAFDTNLPPHGISMTKAAMARAMAPDPIGLDWAQLRGIVLRVDKKAEEPGEGQNDSWWTRFTNASFLADNDRPRMIEMRVRIPELHQWIPIPAGPNSRMVELYPVFTSTDSFVASQDYAPGDIVNVDYENRLTLEGGVLLGPIQKGIPSAATSDFCDPACYDPTFGGATPKKDKSKKTSHTGDDQGARDKRSSAVVIVSKGHQRAGPSTTDNTLSNLLAIKLNSQGYQLVSNGGSGNKLVFSPKKADAKGPEKVGTKEYTFNLDEDIPTDMLGKAMVKAALKEANPEIVVLQFNLLFATPPSPQPQTETDLKALIQKELGAAMMLIKSHAPNVKKIGFIGTFKEKYGDASTLLSTRQYDATPGSARTPSDWMLDASFTNSVASVVPKGVTLFLLDPFTHANNKPYTEIQWKNVIIKLVNDLSIGRATVKTPPPPAKKAVKANDPNQLVIKKMGTLNAGIKTRDEADDYLKKIAYGLTGKTDDASKWQNVLKPRQGAFSSNSPPPARGFGDQSGVLEDEEIEKLVPGIAMHTWPSSESPLSRTTLTETQSRFLRQTLQLKIVEAMETFDKGVDTKLPDDLTKSAGATNTWSCNENGQFVAVPPGSTFNNDPKSLAKFIKKIQHVDLSKCRKQRKGKIHTVITIWPSVEHFIAQEGNGWEAALSSFDAVSLKLCDGSSILNKNNRTKKNIDWLMKFRDQTQFGFKNAIHGWGFHYMRNKKAAIAEATIAAKTAMAAGVVAYWVNCEKHFMGVEDQPPTVDPTGSAMWFANTFRNLTKNKIALIYNGYGHKTIAAQDSKGIPKRAGLTNDAIAFYDGYAPMNYGTRQGTVARKYINRKKRAVEAGVKYCPMHGNGRISKKGGIWGFGNDAGDPSNGKYNKRKSKQGDGLMTLAKKYGRNGDWIAFWYGSGKGAVCTAGNAANPSLSDMVRNIRAGQNPRLPIGTSTGGLGAGGTLGAVESGGPPGAGS